ncbi:MAG: Methionine import ATP-binding protein MetN [Lachnoclostridium sp.]|jgi:D-methionine transport system ATP-binding protein
MIELINLTKEFKSGKNKKLTVLDNISLKIDDGDIFGIIGMSGAGKSTLIRCINLLERPTSGRIKIDGVDITDIKGRELLALRKNIGMIFQNFNLLMQKNVRKNIAFGLEIIPLRDFKVSGMKEEEYKKLSYFKKRKAKKAEINKRIDELLDLVDLKSKEFYYPSRLSGGQRQRVAIARALATRPSILLCDEATSALDSMTTDSILKLLKKINEETKVTIIVITHEMNVVRKICNKVAVLDNSKIVASGSTEEVFNNSTSEVVMNLVGGGNV